MIQISNAVRLIKDVLDGQEYAAECEEYIRLRMKHLPKSDADKEEEEFYQLQSTLAEEFTTTVLLYVLTA